MKPDSKPFCWKELLVQLLRNEDDTETLEDPSINEILVQNEILIIDDDSYQGPLIERHVSLKLTTIVWGVTG